MPDPDGPGGDLWEALAAALFHLAAQFGGPSARVLAPWVPAHQPAPGPALALEWGGNRHADALAGAEAASQLTALPPRPHPAALAACAGEDARRRVLRERAASAVVHC